MKKHKTILVTGATSGVGLAVTKQLLAKGEHVIAAGRSAVVLQELSERGARVVCADLLSTDGINKLADAAGTPDIVIFCAGVGTFEKSHELTDIAVEQMIELNIQTPIRLTNRLLPGMMERKSGHFIFLGSQAGKVATVKASVYAATKHALIGYTNALRLEVSSHGIKVSVIHPGPIDTPFLDHADSTGIYRQSVQRYMLSADQVADSVVRVIKRPVREVNLPAWTMLTSKLYALAPAMVERLGRRFFMKK